MRSQFLKYRNIVKLIIPESVITYAIGLQPNLLQAVTLKLC